MKASKVLEGAITHYKGHGWVQNKLHTYNRKGKITASCVRGAVLSALSIVSNRHVAQFGSPEEAQIFPYVKKAVEELHPDFRVFGSYDGKHNLEDLAKDADWGDANFCVFWNNLAAKSKEDVVAVLQLAYCFAQIDEQTAPLRTIEDALAKV